LERRPDFLPFGRPNFSDEEIDAVARVLRSGWIGTGAEVQAFEQELAEYVGAPHVVALDSCTSALHLSLAALGVGPGDEVICPSLTWCSSANAALYLGADAVFCDVDPNTLCLTAETIASKLSPRTKAVVAVHFGGLAIDPTPIRDMLPEDVHVVEDAAHALGAKYPDGASVGSSGRPTCFSFYANKNLSTADGGAVALADGKMVEALRCLQQHGQSADAWRRYTDSKNLLITDVMRLGFKANYTDLHAAIGRVQLRRLPQLQQRRREVAECYARRLSSAELGLQWQQNVFDVSHALHLAVVLLPVERLAASRDEIVVELRQRNIGATIHYTPLHSMPFYEQKYGQCKLPITEDIGRRIMTLPISSSMTTQDAEYVCEHLVDVLRQAAR
jgi:dTDP-4-amino-4,6-dideoxygalactose transaminase